MAMAIKALNSKAEFPKVGVVNRVSNGVTKGEDKA
jgi:hypothetical protein